tara:strand:- start:104 stop:304 length:201 start_codon:yes stop_codon:yes gene_type:complete
MIFKLIIKNFLLSILFILISPLLLAGLSGFIYNINDLSRWEELNYIFIFLPSLFVFTFATKKLYIK